MLIQTDRNVQYILHPNNEFAYWAKYACNNNLQILQFYKMSKHPNKTISSWEFEIAAARFGRLLINIHILLIAINAWKFIIPQNKLSTVYFFY